jgi:protein-S-isoprenylcysteine O-methyltransferase Ste14
MEFVLEPSASAAVYWLTTLLFLAEPLILRGRARRGESRESREEILLIVVSLVAGLALCASFHAAGLGTLGGVAATIFRTGGLCVFAAGVALRYWSALALGPWFTREVHLDPDQELVSRGPYRWLRHPLYTGLLIIALGMAAVFANVPGVLATVGLVAAALYRRVHREEALLEARFAGEYRRWRSRRWGLLPPFR